MLAQGPAVGLEAWVEGKDDRKRLNEYQVQHHPAKNGESSYTECFLETIDEPFRIVVGKLAGKYRVKEFRAEVRVDGSPLDSRAWLWKDRLVTWDQLIHQDADGCKKSSLKFAPLPTTDDATKVTIDPITAKEVGTIEITLTLGSYGRGHIREVDSFRLDTGTVHEKGKKFAYSVSTADSAICERPKMMYYTLVEDPTSKFSHRFIFRYRPRPVLVHMRVIDEPEASPSPPPARPARKRKSDVIDIEEATPEDKEEEGDVKPNLNAKRVKYLEEQVRLLADQLKRSRNGSNDKDDVVDLTLDDD
ncbi:hypothetical protein V866_003797 [Kwoniella sp. B9012]